MERTDLIALLVAAVVVADLVLLAVLLRHLPRAAGERRLRAEEWARRLESDPRLRMLYDAHRRNWWRVGIVTWVDMAASLAASGALWWLLADLGLVSPLHDGLSELELAGVAALGVVVWVSLWTWGIRRLGTNPGMRVARLVAVSSEGGMPVPADKLRPPDKGDYRRDDAPRMLFVPEEELRRPDLPPPGMRSR